ncbi:MAG: hypothetical protein QXF15_01675 [Candidatus Aenigmatarchaeota archaeon]
MLETKAILVTDVDGTIYPNYVISCLSKFNLEKLNEIDNFLSELQNYSFEEKIKKASEKFFNPPIEKNAYDEVIKYIVKNNEPSNKFKDILNFFKPSQLIAFSGTPKEIVSECIREHIENNYFIPTSCFGTQLKREIINNKEYITSEIIELWTGEKRANYVNDLKKYKPNVHVIGVGNSENDIPMLNECDIGFYFGKREDIENHEKIIHVNGEPIENFYKEIIGALGEVF